jgi:hypothetical protein
VIKLKGTENGQKASIEIQKAVEMRKEIFPVTVYTPPQLDFKF